MSFEGVKRSAKPPRTTRTVADVLPATADRWTDLLALFGPQGACYGCWCQYWRRPRAEWRQARASGNRAELERQVHGKRPPGLIGYSADGTPVGWVSLGPREDFPGLRNSRFFGDTPPEPGLWSIVCFYVPVSQRGRSVAAAMLDGAIAYARRAKAKVLEGYPWDLAVKAGASSSLYVGTLSMFVAAGFREESRRVPHRPVVRLRLP